MPSGTGEPLFDTHIIVDWSASSRPSPTRPSENAIWWAFVHDGRHSAALYHRTRQDAESALIAFISNEVDCGRRVLAGFDFPFGYPAGVATQVTRRDDAGAFNLWDWLSAHIRDDERNGNNRFKIAAMINCLYCGKGPFWGRPQKWDCPDIPTRKTDRTTDCGVHPNDMRVAEEHAKGSKSVWQLFGAGSVGSQVLLGLGAINRIRKHAFLGQHTVVWPFDNGLHVPGQKSLLVVAEVYPSLLKEVVDERHRDGETIKDRAQVLVNAEAFAALDSQGGLAPLFRGSEELSPSDKQCIEKEEGWILGLGHEQELVQSLTGSRARDS